jgi:hypothetical protein
VAPRPPLAGCGWGGGGFRRIQLCGESPSPDLASLRSTSPRKRGEVTAAPTLHMRWPRPDDRALRRDATINGRPGADPTGSAPSDTAKRGSDLADTRPKGHDGIPDHIRPPPAQGPDWLAALMRMSALLFDLQAQAAWPTRLRQQTRKTPRRPRPVTTLLTSMLSFGLADSRSGYRASRPRR